jgi:hypothetical protein
LSPTQEKNKKMNITCVVCVKEEGNHRRFHLGFATEDDSSAAGEYACNLIQSSLTTQAVTSTSCGWAARICNLVSGQVGQCTDLETKTEKKRLVCDP